MPDSVRERRRRANALSSRAPDSADLLARILDTPHLAQAVPRLQPPVLHRVIQHCGLEACSDLVALATPEQLSAVFDLDLWSSRRGGQDEQFDADRFGVWLEVLAESGADVAASKLAAIDAALVITALARDMRVFDPAAGVGDGSGREVGGYRLVATRGDVSDTIVDVLAALEAAHPEYFHRVMQGCRTLSNSAPEVDGLDDLLTDAEQVLFDMAFGRELRREKQGFVTPAQARAFLQMSRQPHSGEHVPAENTVAAAYFRAIEWNAPAPSPASEESAPEVEGDIDRLDVLEVLDILDVLTEAGVLEQRPQALLTGTTEDAPRFAHLRRHLECVSGRNDAAGSLRSQELVFLANVIVAGCSVQARPLTAQEASDGAAAVCNLGLQNWPGTLADDFLVGHDLVHVFQAGWRILHQDVCMFAAERLIAVLRDLRCEDRMIQADLNKLRIELTRHWRQGEPWRSREALETIAMLDMPASLALAGLLAEFPVMHAGIHASGPTPPRSFSASAFEFVSENGQIAIVRDFMASLPDTLSR
jgi:hypothetical protein